MAIGRAAEMEQQEGEHIAASEKRAKKVARFRCQVIAAERKNLGDPAKLSGEYVASQGPNLTLSVSDDGRAEGKFTVGFMSDSVLSGSFQGRAVRFTWKAGAESSYSYNKKTGHGELILRPDGNLEGFYAEGDATKDSVNADKWQPWELSAKPSPKDSQ